MQGQYSLFTKPLLFLSLVLVVGSCQKEDLSEEKKAVPLNSFTMQVNGQAWHPSQIGDDACMRTYQAAWSALNGKPYYNISAYRDTQATASFESKNVLKLQIMDVQQTGVYFLTGSYQQDFTSYAIFIINKPDGTHSRYLNKVNTPSFSVEVNEFIPVPESYIKGIKGSFKGTLYNETNPLDSITLSNGAFTFSKINWFNFNQCAQ
jgi:hypothetical protein